jgi:hypothetical protein
MTQLVLERDADVAQPEIPFVPLRYIHRFRVIRWPALNAKELVRHILIMSDMGALKTP